MPMITVIVPVYNVRDYLENCIQSVRDQSFADWELLLIDDGSDDGSGELCRAAAGADPRVRCIAQANAGVSAARNAGLDAAAGDYVTFLDADDTFAPDHLKTLYELAVRTGAEVTASGMALRGADGAVFMEIRLAPGIYTGTKEILSQYLLASEQIFGGCNKLFLRRLIGDTRFAPYRRSEDALFSAQVLSRAERYAVSGEVGYIYYRRADSATMRPADESSLDQLRAWEEIYALLRRCAPELCPAAAEKICRDIDRIQRTDTPWGQELRRARIRYYPLQFPGGRLPLKKKLAAALYRLSPEAYYRLNTRRAAGNGGAHE